MPSSSSKELKGKASCKFLVDIDNDVPARSPDLVRASLASLLLRNGLCATSEEAECVSESCVDDKTIDAAADAAGGERVDENDDEIGSSPSISPFYDSVVIQIASSMRDCFPDDLSESGAISMTREALQLGAVGGECDGARPIDDESSSSSSEVKNNYGEEEERLEDDGNYIGDGECELCERIVRLTRHHLVPKSTWPRTKKRLLRLLAEKGMAATDEEDGGGDESRYDLMALRDVAKDSSAGNGASSTSPRVVVTRYLSRTCFICRPCHDAVHRIHSETELAERYNTVERLLEDEHVVRFCRWASKQRPGKYAV